MREGLVLVNAMHITASVFINDDESGLHRDFERWLEKLAPEKPYSPIRAQRRRRQRRRAPQAHDHGPGGRGGDHRRRLDLGPWEQIFYYELDGKRDKRVLVKIIGE